MHIIANILWNEGGKVLSAKKVIQTYLKEIDVQPKITIIGNREGQMTYEIDGEDGKALIEVITIFPGIFLQFHSVHCKSFRLPLKRSNLGHGLKISYCTEGRAEIRMSDNRCLFMEPGLLSLDTRTAQDYFRFPSGHYHGVELYIDDYAEEELPIIWEEFGISLDQIKDKFSMRNEDYKVISHTIHATESFKSIFLSLINRQEEYGSAYLSIKIIELLVLLQNIYSPEEYKFSTLMTIGQVEIAKKMQETITNDLAEHHSLESLSKEFGVSSSSLKNYFQGVYGKNVSTYLREYRMSEAAVALSKTTMSVSDIAAKVGYQNASKFSAAFKKFYGESPLEYRRQCKCGI